MHKNLSLNIVSLFFFVCLFVIYQLIIRGGIKPAFIFAILPAIAICGAGLFHRQLSFYLFFIINYGIMGLSRYFPMKTGLIMLGLTMGLLFLIFLKTYVILSFLICIIFVNMQNYLNNLFNS